MTFREAVEKRVLVFDGAMGTQIQGFDLKASDFGGKEGANDLLTLTRPDLVEAIHGRYFAAGCDVVETNTFGSSRLKLDEYGLGHRTYEVNFRAAILARRAAERHATPGQPRFVAGSMGPTGMLPVVVRPGALQHHRRRAGEDLLRAGPRPHRRRRRRHPHRDPAGHPGAAGRGAGGRRGPARGGAGRLPHGAAHAHRRLRAHAARHRRLGGARDHGAAAPRRGGHQLLHRPRRDAGERAHALPEVEPLRLGDAQRRPARERERPGRVQALPGGPGRGAGRVRRRLRRGPGGRLLRHHPGAHARAWSSGSAPCRPRGGAAPGRSPSSPRP